ncbi:MAG: cell division ATP-binding protein FtsE [Gammaproteobacteria bacterium]|nr:cell division ATP-binding protein FtsE [Gammaproteobacteria bacterium]
MIQFVQVSKRYDSGYEALAQLSFEVKKGELVFLTGHSGAGKTTIIKLIAMLDRPTQGQIFFNQLNLNQISPRDALQLRQQMGIIFQNPHLLMDRTVFDNVALPLHITNFDPREIPKRVRAALDKVGLLKKEKSLPAALSVGEQQRVSIARAIVNKPVALLADEPTGNLDPELARDIMTLFQQFHQVGVTLLVASHDLALIAKMPHRVVSLQRGRLKKEKETAYA